LITSENGNFANYASHARSHMKAIMAPADSPNEDAFVLGDVAAELEIEARPDDDDDSDSDDEYSRKPSEGTNYILANKGGYLHLLAKIKLGVVLTSVLDGSG